MYFALIYAITVIVLIAFNAYWANACLRQAIKNAQQTHILRQQMSNMIAAQLSQNLRTRSQRLPTKDWDQSNEETQTIQESLERAYTQFDLRKP